MEDRQRSLDLMFKIPKKNERNPAHQWKYGCEKIWQVRCFTRGITIQKCLVRHSRQGILFMYFPVRKNNCSLTLASFWWGPFKVQKKLSVSFTLSYAVLQGKTESLINIWYYSFPTLNHYLHYSNQREKVPFGTSFWYLLTKFGSGNNK